ncbi:DUF6221 family protein [Micromonospora chalcea]|uniref:DUF6221 family protein n=1 Tax=Micromonospora chalcea TaxID=1874 RepID=UPI00380DF44E
MFDLLRWDTAGVGAGGRVAESSELRGRGDTVEDMIAWLNGVLDQREGTAREATECPWMWKPLPGGKAKLALVGADEQIVLLAASADSLPSAHDASHIALNGPAQILADVAADRAILGALTAALDEHDGQSRAWDSDSERARTETVTLKQVVRVLAAKYATWPGYQEVWPS